MARHTQSKGELRTFYPQDSLLRRAIKLMEIYLKIVQYTLDKYGPGQARPLKRGTDFPGPVNFLFKKKTFAAKRGTDFPVDRFSRSLESSNQRK